MCYQSNSSGKVPVTKLWPPNTSTLGSLTCVASQSHQARCLSPSCGHQILPHLGTRPVLLITVITQAAPLPTCGHQTLPHLALQHVLPVKFITQVAHSPACGH